MGGKHCFLPLPARVLLSEAMPHVPLLCISGMHVTLAGLLVPGEGLNHSTFVNPSLNLTASGPCWQLQAEDSHQTLVSFTFKFQLKQQHFRQVRSASGRFILMTFSRIVAAQTALQTAEEQTGGKSIHCERDTHKNKVGTEEVFLSI